jgi:hypothetical protein
MSQEQREFIDSLNLARNGGIAIAIDTANGPILPIHSINFTALPVHQTLKDLIQNINNSQSAYDKGRQTSRNDDTVGAMRQIHANEPHYLPVLNVGNLSGRGKVYNAYATANKSHTNDRGGGAATTGYVEYTAADLAMYSWGGNRMRLVFDYVNGRIFFAPFHYASWDLSKVGDLDVIDKPGIGSAWPSPFFWIIEISKKI